MNSIYTLIPDIQSLLKSKGGWLTDSLSEEFANEVSQRLRGQFQERTQVPSLRLSQMGPKCPRALWFSIYKAGEAQALPPWTELKFSFGHIIEGFTIALAKAAGHEVVGEQDAVDVDGVVGHRDCIIDGCLVDIKSAATLSYKKFEDGTIAEKDTFGYLDQLDGYLVGSHSDPLLRVKDRAYLLAVDKQLGHMCLYEHRFDARNAARITNRVREYKEIIGRVQPPECNCQSIADGEAGNLILDTRASYSPYKFCCNPQLRTFIYSKGPRYFTRVVKRPTYKGEPLMEIDRYGNPVYI